MASKMIKCKTCGNDIAKTAKVCPHCGAKCNIDLPLGVRLLITFLGLIVLLNIFSNGSENEDDKNNIPENSDSSYIEKKDDLSPRNSSQDEKKDSETLTVQADSKISPAQEGSSTKGETQLLLDDDFVKVSFVEVFEEPNIEGVFYFRLCVENKTDKTVTIYLEDPSVNKVSTLALSGIPMTIQPNTKSLNPFFFSYKNLDISSISELEEISFCVNVKDDETFDDIETSDFLTIPF